MEKKWYAKVTNKGSAHEQGLVIDENTGESIAVTFKPENAALVASAPEMLEALQEIFAVSCIDADDGELALSALQSIRHIADLEINKIKNA